MKISTSLTRSLNGVVRRTDIDSGGDGQCHVVERVESVYVLGSCARRQVCLKQLHTRMRCVQWRP